MLRSCDMYCSNCTLKWTTCIYLNLWSWVCFFIQCHGQSINFDMVVGGLYSRVYGLPGPLFTLSPQHLFFFFKLRTNQSDQERNKLAVFQAVMFSKVFLISTDALFGRFGLGCQKNWYVMASRPFTNDDAVNETTWIQSYCSLVLYHMQAHL